MDTATLLQNVNSLMEMHAEGLLGGEVMPEDVHVVPDNELLNVLTLGMALNYQRNSYKVKLQSVGFSSSPLIDS